jgi:hypothetical protein
MSFGKCIFLEVVLVGATYLLIDWLFSSSFQSPPSNYWILALPILSVLTATFGGRRYGLNTIPKILRKLTEVEDDLGEAKVRLHALDTRPDEK